MGLRVAGVFGFCIQLANHQKVKCLEIVKSLEAKAYSVKVVVMPARLGVCPIILGRPWLHAVNVMYGAQFNLIILPPKNAQL